jgi:hypothetical protein
VGHGHRTARAKGWSARAIFRYQSIAFKIKHFHDKPGWRNWQTQRTQKCAAIPSPLSSVSGSLPGWLRNTYRSDNLLTDSRGDDRDSDGTSCELINPLPKQRAHPGKAIDPSIRVIREEVDKIKWCAMGNLAGLTKFLGKAQKEIGWHLLAESARHTLLV